MLNRIEKKKFFTKNYPSSRFRQFRTINKKFRRSRDFLGIEKFQDFECSIPKLLLIITVIYLMDERKRKKNFKKKPKDEDDEERVGRSLSNNHREK